MYTYGKIVGSRGQIKAVCLVGLGLLGAFKADEPRPTHLGSYRSLQPSGMWESPSDALFLWQFVSDVLTLEHSQSIGGHAKLTRTRPCSSEPSRELDSMSSIPELEKLTL
jgi:hypothetical protein